MYHNREHFAASETVKEPYQLAFDDLRRFAMTEYSVAIDTSFPQAFADELSRSDPQRGVRQSGDPAALERLRHVRDDDLGAAHRGLTQ